MRSSAPSVAHCHGRSLVATIFSLTVIAIAGCRVNEAVETPDADEGGSEKVVVRMQPAERRTVA
jgi:hypothetical protein